MPSRYVYGHRRRAAAAVYVVVALSLILGYAALSVDVGHMYNVRTELQAAADAAALATAGALAEDPNYGAELFVPDQGSLLAVARQFAEANHPVNGVLADADWELGNWDEDDTVFSAGGGLLMIGRKRPYLPERSDPKR